MSRKIIDSRSGGAYTKPQPFFDRNDFNASIWKHGYDIVCEQAVRCPCQGDSDSALPNCLNCHGSGYFYVNPTRTKALITGLNKNTQFVQWTPELIGTSAITVIDEDKDLIAFFNRVTVEDEYAVFTEMLVVRDMLDNTQAVFTSYASLEILSAYIFQSSTQPLKKLINDVDFHISNDNPYCLVFSEGIISAGSSVSVVYKHYVEYHVIDLPHEIRSSLAKNPQTGAFDDIKLPIQAIGRRAHLVDVRRPNYDGGGIIHNDDATN